MLTTHTWAAYAIILMLLVSKKLNYNNQKNFDVENSEHS